MTWKNPNWTMEKKQWFMKLVEGMVTKPDAANILTINDSLFDLHVVIVVAPEDEHIFTAVVIEDLTKKLGKEVDVLAPLLYLDGKPDHQQQERLSRAYHDL